MTAMAYAAISAMLTEAGQLPDNRSPAEKADAVIWAVKRRGDDPMEVLRSVLIAAFELEAQKDEGS